MILKNFIDCSFQELEMILKWRNSNDIRAASFNDNIISLDEHLDFVEKIRGGDLECKRFFLLSDNIGYLGVISFSSITETDAEIGYYKNPDRAEKGIGVLLLQEAARYAKEVMGLKEVVTEVFDNNQASTISMDRAGFIKHDELSNKIFLERNNKKIYVIVYKRTL